MTIDALAMTTAAPAWSGRVVDAPVSLQFVDRASGSRTPFASGVSRRGPPAAVLARLRRRRVCEHGEDRGCAERPWTVRALCRLTTRRRSVRVTQPSAARASGPIWSCGVSLTDTVFFGVAILLCLVLSLALGVYMVVI